MITSVLGGMVDNPENCSLFKISRKKILFIFCIFILYKVISISLDLTLKFLIFALQIIFIGFKVECSSSISQSQLDIDNIILNCKYNFNV